MSLIRACLRLFVLYLIFVSGCAARQEVYDGTVSIAVWDIEDLTPGGEGQPDLGGLLSGKVIETLHETGDLMIIERERLSVALEELNLGSSSLADESTKLRLGKIIGAQLMIFGGYQVIGGRMRLDVRLVEVETGKLLKAAERTVSSSNLSGWLNAAGEVTKELFWEKNGGHP